MSTITVTVEQSVKAKAVLLKRMKDAKVAFLAANPDYEQPTFTEDDLALVQAFGGDANAIVRETGHALRDGLRLLLTKSEAALPAETKYTMLPWLGAKRYAPDGRVKRMGYQSAADRVPPLNRFVTSDGETFMALRADGLFCLMADDEIDAFVEQVEIDPNLYFQLMV